MADDRRYFLGWGMAVILLGVFGLLGALDVLKFLAAFGLFLAFMGIAMAALTNMGRREPMLAGAGMGLLVLGAALTAVSYDLASGWVIFMVILIVIGIGLAFAGLRGGD